MQLVPDPDFEALRKVVNIKYEAMIEQDESDVSDDIEMKEILEFWPRNKDKMKLLGSDMTLDSLTHKRLLYAMRNALVHEFNEPGYGMDFDESREEPYYHCMRRSNGNQTTLELVYPLRFFRKLCDNGIEALEKYYKENMLDPYAIIDKHFLSVGTYWIKELNQE